MILIYLIPYLIFTFSFLLPSIKALIKDKFVAAIVQSGNLYYIEFGSDLFPDGMVLHPYKQLNFATHFNVFKRFYYLRILNRKNKNRSKEYKLFFRIIPVPKAKSIIIPSPYKFEIPFSELEKWYDTALDFNLRNSTKCSVFTTYPIYDTTLPGCFKEPQYYSFEISINFDTTYSRSAELIQDKSTL